MGYNEELLLVGFVYDFDNSLTPVYGMTEKSGDTSFYYANSCYGIVGVCGLKGLNVTEELSENMEARQGLIDILIDPVQRKERHAETGLLRFGQKILAINNVESFDAEIQPLVYHGDASQVQHIDYFVDVVDVDEVSDEYEMVAEVLNYV